ncbi:hypothetical protein KCQ_08441 [Pectobacterium atrosepticum ICMP 1526]|uniref:hypothetical protein n=1 Tax=Pectobacterium atrosepticum TaxID=29471 RepID=UPI00065D9223|nr:hypothetical protein [Pectobacterium atrosepticum]KMK82059.1 hypothetical protein KCQ_08441 [Pectobacterium atrosepticum ICMP 1526]
MLAISHAFPTLFTAVDQSVKPLPFVGADFARWLCKSVEIKAVSKINGIKGSS